VQKKLKTFWFGGNGTPLRESAVSSVVEHYLDTVGVTGSNPVSRTMFYPKSTPRLPRWHHSESACESRCCSNVQKLRR
jgi:hypothetical protein